MTDDKIALRALLEKGSDTTFLREMSIHPPKAAGVNVGAGSRWW